MSVLRQTYNVLEAENGAAGWGMLRQNSRVELVISDIEMPELDGYGLICKIRAVEDPGLREIPVVVITSAEDDITRERAYACGANDFILKPFNANQLFTCVQNQINEYRASTGAPPIATTTPVAQPPTNVVSMPIADTGPGTVETALQHIDNGFAVLRGLKTASIAPHALSLVMRFLPLLKYCNAKFNLGMDREIAVFQQRVAAARDAEASSAKR
jgi:CheY-like chemotaxis protein